MDIGLMNLEPTIVNSAMMQVSQYWKNQGANVWEYNPLFDYDKVYAFSLFDFTDKSLVTPNMITGGTGFDIKKRLPKEIEDCDYDWSIYPDCDFSMVWFSRGCFRNCPFCIVNEKEGNIHPVEPKNLNPNGKYIKVMDNNFFANPNWGGAVRKLLKWGQPVDIQGFDIRILDELQCDALTRLKHYQAVKFAWDNPRDNLDDKIELLLDYIKPRYLMCYVLTNYWSTFEEDYQRVMHLWDEYKIHSFVMQYKKGKDDIHSHFARWVNNKRMFKTRSWEEYWNGNRR